jgi:tRNA 2-thiouridine synthesizing protein C
MNEAKSLLLICRQPPMAGPQAREALELALAGAAFELPVSLLFMDDGVFQLSPAQNAAALEQKSLAANLQALELFGIEDCYVCQHSLQQRGLDAASLQPSAKPLDETALRSLLSNYSLVMTL